MYSFTYLTNTYHIFFEVYFLFVFLSISLTAALRQLPFFFPTLDKTLFFFLNLLQSYTHKLPDLVRSKILGKGNMDAELYQGDYVKDGGEFFDPTSRKAAKKAGHGAKPAHLRGLSKIIYGENVASLKPNCVHDLSLLNLSEACEDTPAVTSNMQKVPSMSDLSDDSQGKKSFHLNLKIITFTFTPRKVDEFFILFVLSSDNSLP
ncbi:unnamed protein product [Acanthosepion pharaonis]|uniref:Uncharacterized protein n=1 Tax=Acanthosepion pharaonis TaxID=158019 RepID=A0A812C9T8_ACAPH|nr:unnamed protein product [Sepia pharaonis]